MKEIAVCVDASTYAASVCDHAAWICGRASAAATVVHALAPGEPIARSDRIVEEACSRLRDQGVETPRTLRASGDLPEALASAAADIIVLGKRGEASSDDHAGLGRNAGRILEGFNGPACFVSRVFLPIHRALVLIDANPSHRTTVEALAADPVLRDLELDILMAPSDLHDGVAKLAWARRVLGGRRADIYPAQHATAEAVAARYLSDHPTDLIVFSREMMFDPRRPVGDAVATLWSLRTPVFVC